MRLNQSRKPRELMLSMPSAARPILRKGMDFCDWRPWRATNADAFFAG
jgi:hypothetical protein